MLAALLACLLAALVAGCESLPSTGTGPASVDRAELLIRQDNPAAAARMYEQLAATNPAPERNDLLLSAARAWLAANRADDAQRVLDAPASGVTQKQLFERELLRGEVAIARGQYAPAWEQVAKIPVPTAPVDASRLYLLQQQVALRAGQAVAAVRAGIERERVAANENERNRVRRELLNDLRNAIERGLRVDPAASRDTVVSGWLEIGEIAASATRAPLAAPAAVERWRGRFPNHPASGIATSEIIALAERESPRGAQADAAPVALLLPLTGPNAVSVAGLIRDGFMARIARLPENSRPSVRVYDTGVLPVGTALQNARSDGAAFIVGPLTRDELLTAVEQRPGNTPMLLLNSIGGSGFAGASIFQYALAPEDEARQIARHLAGAGQRNVLVLAPSGSWGTRVANAFAEELTRAGGQVVAQTNYDRASSDPTAQIQAALGIADSNSRFQSVRSATGIQDLGFVARPRPDIDAIFVAGYEADRGAINPLRLIYPILNRHARDIPVFITRDALDADTPANRDLLGAYLLDIPWNLESGGAVADLRDSTESIWKSGGASNSRYFAFGYDAAAVALAIRRPSATWPMNALTGSLNLAVDGRVERNLQWARVGTGGVVQPADPAAK